MTSETGDPRQTLERERERLEGVLETNDAWRALRQLEQREAEGRPVSAVDIVELRTRIEGALEGNRVFQARRKISEAITLLGEPSAPAVPASALPSSAPASAQPRIADRIVTIAAVTARATASVQTSAPPAPQPSDNLTLIRGIDGVLAVRLEGLGVTSFDAIAAWTTDDVRRVSAALGFERTIQRQNWIEQAALIALRRRPPPAAQSMAQPAPPPARPIADLVAAAVRSILAKAKPPQLLAPLPAASASHSPPALAPPAADLVVAVAADDLTAIRGLDPRIAAVLASEGITTFAAIAAWSPADVLRLRGLLGPGVPVVRAQWIEQAAILAAGHATHYARTRAPLAGLPLAPRPALTAIARDEGFACDLARLSPPKPVTQLAASPALAAVPETAPILPVEVALTSMFDPGADAQSPPRHALEVVVSPPAPVLPGPHIPVANAPKPRVPFKLPPLALATAIEPPAAAPPLAALPAGEATDASKPPAPPVALYDPADDTAFDGDCYDSLDIDYDEANLYGDAASAFGEADVRIVARAPEDAITEPEIDPRPLVYGSGAGTLQSRLRKASDPEDDFDARGYAAYRSAVEEASVEIVHRGSAPRSAAATAKSGEPADAPANATPDDVAPTTVRRFLKSLTGQDR